MPTFHSDSNSVPLKSGAECKKSNQRLMSKKFCKNSTIPHMFSPVSPSRMGLDDSSGGPPRSLLSLLSLSFSERLDLDPDPATANQTWLRQIPGGQNQTAQSRNVKWRQTTEAADKID